MAEYVQENISKDELYDIQGDNYCPGGLEEDAVNFYFDMPIKRKIALHEQMLKELRNERDSALAKEAAAIDAMLDENIPFGEDSPISHEYAEFMRGLITENRKKVDRLEHEIHEEEQWRGGHEEGSEDF